MAVPKYSTDDYGFYDFIVKDAFDAQVYPDWDAELKVEFYDSTDTLKFTATTSSDPALEKDTDAQGPFVKVSGIPLSGWALGIVTAKIYAKVSAAETAPYPMIATAFQVIEGGEGYATDVAHVRDSFNLPDTIESDLILVHLPAAQRKIKRWVGADAYEDAISQAPENTERAAAVRDGEARLTGWYGLLDWARRAGAQGIIQSGADGDKSYSLKTTGDLERERQAAFDMAEDILSEYVSVAAPTTELVEAQDYSEESSE